MGTEWEQDHQNGTRIEIKRNKNKRYKMKIKKTKVGTKWEQKHQNGTKMGTK